ncbi:hypothetical protein BG005_011556 [Podila minutissima]|nr:hypothetical protein BG005_011556 [Podila minutissima]
MRLASILTTLLAPLAVLASSSHHVHPAVENVPSDNSDTISIMAANKGTLYVKLNHATNLRDKDWLGKSDPFVEMWLDKSYKQRSKDTKGLNPVFNQTFCFYVRAGQNKLYVRAVDKDTFSNDKIGEASISLVKVMATGREGPQDYELPKWFGLRSNGRLNMQMQFIEDNSATRGLPLDVEIGSGMGVHVKSRINRVHYDPDDGDEDENDPEVSALKVTVSSVIGEVKLTVSAPKKGLETEDEYRTDPLIGSVAEAFWPMG